jgi:hypothetical protein
MVELRAGMKTSRIIGDFRDSGKTTQGRDAKGLFYPLGVSIAEEIAKNPNWGEAIVRL